VVVTALSTQVTISTEQVDLLSVTGRLDDTGLTQLRMQLEALFDTGAVHLVVDLAGVTCCWQHQRGSTASDHLTRS
jgi:anti-anti-sigma regulatory factor